MRSFAIALLLFALLAPSLACNPLRDSERGLTWTFMTAGDQLFARRGHASFGPAKAIYQATDDGWTDSDVPLSTISMAKRDGVAYALSNDGELRIKAANGWQRLFREPLSSTSREYAYHVLASKDGGSVITCARHLSLYDAQGQQTGKIDAPDSEREVFFIECQFADESESKLIVTAHPYLIYVYDIERQALEPWTEGINERTSTVGPATVRRHGQRYLASKFSNIYVADGLQQPWQLYYHEGNGAEFDWHCCDLISHDAEQDEWLLADGNGLHLMTGKKKTRTIFTDAPDDHDLILEVTRFRDDYIVSFARLKDGCMGVRVSADLKELSDLRMED
jgi:hypothetical protein